MAERTEPDAPGARLPRLVAAAGRAAPSLLQDLAGLGGAALIAYGAHEIYHPAGWIVAGLELVAGVLMLQVGRSAGRPE
ncbi:MAG: hypothetical protein P4L73_13480 [Caulobacteraceae bacterium]|nr:hypothetical protein [Caulobacteraceae bacterium]